MAYYDFLNIIFAPLLKLPPLWTILIISLIMSILTTFLTKFMTDQNLMKKLREDMKENQKQMKEARSDQAKVMELQKKHGRLAMEQFKNSIKPTFVTIIPFILIFGWMSSTFAYENINPQEEFTVSVLFQKNTVGEVEIIVIEG
ncbi:MAG: EMC3/TMCO1 family protein, partial [Candidatus Woesearchaeota archaeon]|nr:EMC3/TMCO1 family protein [Candidatus Woesearchaeota archaeon]